MINSLENQVKQLFLEGRTIEEIAKLLNIGKNRTRNFIKNGGWVLSSKVKKEKIQRSIDKAKNTFIKNYGVTNPSYCPEIISKIQNTFRKHQKEDPNFQENIRNKVKTTSLKKYGVTNYGKSLECKNRMKNTLIFKNGRLNLQSHITHYEHYNPQYIINNFISIDKKLEVEKICKYFNISLSHLNKLKKKWKIDFPNKTSYKSNLEYFLESLNCNKLEINNRQIIKPLEIDFIINDILAIELDGILFHCETNEGVRTLPFKGSKTIKWDKFYHLKKTLLAKEKGLELLHILDIEWSNPIKRSIWESIIKNKLKKLKTLSTSRCSIREISSKKAKLFLNNNHLEGEISGDVYLGLFHKKQLVSIMVLRKSKASSSNKWVLLRFCNYREIFVEGSFSKLLDHFIKSYNPSSIITLVNRRWSNGSFLEFHGFKLVREISPNSFFFKNTRDIISINHCSKQKLSTILKNYDPKQNINYNMFSNGWKKFSDCGSLVYILKITTLKEL